MMPLYKRATAPIDDRVADLMSRMTLEDKLAELRDGLKASNAGVGVSPRGSTDRINAAQRAAMSASRHGIPVLFHGDGAANGAAALPHALGLAASWDPALVRELHGVIAREARARGARLVAGPELEIARDPRQGRIQETFGEDAYLVGELGVAAIEGLQGGGAPRLIAPDKVLAAARHLAGEGPPGDEATAGPAPISERELREVHLAPFEEVVRRTGVAAIVAARNAIDAVPTHANRWLLDDVLRGEWSFRGVVLGARGGIDELMTVHRVAATRSEAALLAFEAGVDGDLSNAGAPDALAGAVRAGRVSMARLDAALARLLELKFRAGLFEKPYTDTPDAAVRNRDTSTRAIASRAARRAIVLLKNDRALPLALPAPGHARPTIAVVELGGARLLDAIRTQVRGRAQVVPAQATPEATLQAARAADSIVLAIGAADPAAGEWIAALKPLGRPIVVVLVAERPTVTLELAREADALVAAWGLGAYGAAAVAEVLFGEANPGGKLPVTLARNAGQMPIFNDAKPSARRGYLFDTTEPLYPFGWGMSYSTFELGAPKLSSATVDANGSVTVSVEVRNTSRRAGDETVQLYVRDKVSSVTRPVKQLRGFQRVTLGPGERRTVTFQLTPRSLWMWDDRMRRVVEPGDFEVMTGANSAQLQTTTLTVVLARTNP